MTINTIKKFKINLLNTWQRVYMIQFSILNEKFINSLLKNILNKKKDITKRKNKNRKKFLTIIAIGIIIEKINKVL